MRRLLLATVLLTAAVPVFAQQPAQSPPRYTTGTMTLQQLVDNPETRAVLEKHMIELLQYVDYFGGQTLKQVQQSAYVHITDDTLVKIEADVAKIK